MRDDILDYLGYEYVTSHMDKKAHKRILIPKSEFKKEANRYDFLKKLTDLCKEAELNDYNLSEEITTKILSEVHLVKDEYTSLFSYNNILASVFYFNKKYTFCYFIKAKTEKQAIGTLKHNALSNGIVYENRNFSEDEKITEGLIKVLQLSFKRFMIVQEYYLEYYDSINSWN